MQTSMLNSRYTLNQLAEAYSEVLEKYETVHHGIAPDFFNASPVSDVGRQGLEALGANGPLSSSSANYTGTKCCLLFESAGVKNLRTLYADAAVYVQSSVAGTFGRTASRIARPSLVRCSLMTAAAAC